MRGVLMIGGPLHGTTCDSFLGKQLHVPYVDPDGTRCFAVYRPYRLVAADLGAVTVLVFGEPPSLTAVLELLMAQKAEEEAQHGHYDLFEDVITKLRFGGLDKKGQHDQLRRVLAAGAQPRSDVFEGSVSPG